MALRAWLLAAGDDEQLADRFARTAEVGGSGPRRRRTTGRGLIPGAWEYRNERFVWAPGYWAHPNGNQAWQPGQYVETAPVRARSRLLGLPVGGRGRFTRRSTHATAHRRRWCFRPRFALGFGGGWGGWGNGGAFGSLFIVPGFNNFCFGNFFNPWGFGGSSFGFGNSFWGPAFGIGFGFGNSFCGWGGCQPWWCQTKGFCNPLWNHYCWLNKNNPNWAKNVQTAHVARAVGAAPRQLAVAPPNGIAQRPLAVSSKGVGGAVQTAARSAAATTKSQPLIQPANQVAKSLPTAKGDLNPSALSNGAPRAGTAPDVRSGGKDNPAVVAKTPGAGGGSGNAAGHAGAGQNAR